jgi:hypothetical protein
MAPPQCLKGVANAAEAATPCATMLRACHQWQALMEHLRGFWTAPVMPRSLAWFRVGLVSVLLVQALSLLGHLDDLFGRYGVVAWSVQSNSRPQGVPNLAWLDEALSFLGLPAAFAVPLGFSVYVGGLLGLLLGYRTRLAAGIAWLSHTALMASGDMAMYGVDQFAQIGLFYCVWFPAGEALSFDQSSDRGHARPTFGAWLALRILQLHVCIIYTASGVEKALGEQWWNGEAIWRAVMSAPIDPPIDCSFLATIPWLAKALCWMTLLLEAGVVAFVWHPRLRKLWLIGIVGMHLNIALLMNLWTFSATMIVFDVAAFGVAPRHRECSRRDVLWTCSGSAAMPGSPRPAASARS